MIISSVLLFLAFTKVKFAYIESVCNINKMEDIRTFQFKCKGAFPMFKYTFSDKAVPVFQQDNTTQEKTEMQDGYMLIEVIRPDGSPIPKVSVMVYTLQNGKPVTERVVQTGIDGRTETISLAAPVKKYSLTETSIDVQFSVFILRLEIEGYYTEIYKNAPVFPATTITYKCTLTPLPFGVKNSK